MTSPLASQNLEQELKLEIEHAEYLRLCVAWDPPVHILQQQNFFFRSPALLHARLALRLRKENSRYFLTCKGPTSPLGLAVQRLEVEQELAPAEATPLLLDPALVLQIKGPVSELLRARDVDDALQPWLRFDNLRKGFEVSLLDRTRLIELDQSDFGDGHKDFELELEFNERQPAELSALHEALRQLLRQQAVDFRVQKKGKLSRAIQAQRGT